MNTSHPPIHRWQKAGPDRGGPETDFSKTTCLHACGSETYPIAMESLKFKIFFEIWSWVCMCVVHFQTRYDYNIN